VEDEMISWLPVVLSVGVVLNGIRLRDRVRRIPMLVTTDEPVAPDHVFLTADGVRLTAAARRSASAHARREGLDVLDLVPLALAAERMVDLVRMVDPRSFRSSGFAPGRGACQALLAKRQVLARAGVEARDDYLPVELADITRRLKRYAPTSTHHAFAPGVACRPSWPAERIVLLLAAHRHREASLILPVVRAAALVAGLVASPWWGVAAVALCWLQPYGVCLGRARMRPAYLVRGPAARIMGWPTFLLDRNHHGDPQRPGRPHAPAEQAAKLDADQARERYRADIAAGVPLLRDPRRSTCPWCGSGDLSYRLTAADTMSRKPGRFRYDACRGCGHVFQNPMVSPVGLEFYYRDFYDGLGGEANEEAFGMFEGLYRARARLLPPTASPSTWLDVGAGHGHFCLAAKAVLPRVTFDALDMGAGVEEASRRGWVRRAYRGMFPGLVEEISGRYDVISMFHYLEHTRDPYLELDTAAKALPIGGYLVIEVPNPRSPAFLGYRSLWMNLCPPQHLHLIPADNLARALADRGLRLVRLQFGRAHIPLDTLAAVFYLLQAAVPDPTLPWLPRQPGARRRAFRALATAVAAPLFVFALAVDVLMLPLYLSGQRANTYRLVARKDA
jgi:hypothetical protein